MALAIRLYKESDRERIRRICYETGYMGESVAWYWKDPESFADMFISYYTDKEPESFLVAVDDKDEVVGYLSGCVDSTKADDPVAIGAKIAFLNLGLLRPSIAPTMWRAIRDAIFDLVLSAQTPPKPFNDSRWPSHLHIDLLGDARGKGVGTKLMDEWFKMLRQVGSPGCFLETLDENKSAIAFFESVGFSRHKKCDPVPGIRTPQGARLHRQIMVRSI